MALCPFGCKTSRKLAFGSAAQGELDLTHLFVLCMLGFFTGQTACAASKHGRIRSALRDQDMQSNTSWRPNTRMSLRIVTRADIHMLHAHCVRRFMGQPPFKGTKYWRSALPNAPPPADESEAAQAAPDTQVLRVSMEALSDGCQWQRSH